MKRVVTFLLVIAVILAAAQLGGFLRSDEKKIEDRMNAFLQAYNSGDLSEALESFDAKTRNTYKSILNVGNTLIGLTGVEIDITDLFTLGVALNEGQILRFDEMEIAFQSDTKATVSTTMHYQDMQSTYSQKVKFTLTKENGDWYICE